MGRGKKPLLEKVEIQKIAAEGKSIAYIDEKVLFVPNTLPGDIVDVQVTRKRKNFMEGIVTHTHRFSALRIAPACTHFGICGGCKWQNLPYEKQLEFKQQEINDNLQRIGKIKLQNVYPIIGSARQLYYRNKLEFTFSNKRFLTREEISRDLRRGPTRSRLGGLRRLRRRPRGAPLHHRRGGEHGPRRGVRERRHHLRHRSRRGVRG